MRVQRVERYLVGYERVIFLSRSRHAMGIALFPTLGFLTPPQTTGRRVGFQFLAETKQTGREVGIEKGRIFGSSSESKKEE